MTVGQGGARGQRTLRRPAVATAVAVALWAGPLGALAHADPGPPPTEDRPGASQVPGPFAPPGAAAPGGGPGSPGAPGAPGALGAPGGAGVPGAFARPGDPSAVTPQPGVSSLPAAGVGDPVLVRLALDIAELRPAADAARVLAERQAGEAAGLRQAADVLGTERAAAGAALQDGESGAAQLAGSDYRGQGLSGLLRLLLTGPSALVPDGVPVAGARAQADLVHRLRGTYAEVSGRQEAAERAAREAGAAAGASRAAQADLERRLADAVAELARDARAKAAPGGGVTMVRAEDSAALPETDAAPSGTGARAVAEALGQLGRPYVWGGAGPEVFDCSGLTSWAWQHAGTPVPRTSQDQWAGLARVPLHDLRPGDLVVYDPGATHVSMYLGGGLVVHAPHPGTVVKIAPLGLLPVLGAVRPDADPRSGPQD